jgi:hypothetical protein
MELKAIKSLNLGDGFFSVVGEIYTVFENALYEEKRVELECTFGLNVGMIVEVSRFNISECFEVVPQN